MKFVLKSSCTDQSESGNIAVVNLTQEDLVHIAEWRRLYEELKAQYSIVCIEFWFTATWWYDDFPYYDDDEVSEMPFTDEQLTLLERVEWTRVPEDFKFPAHVDEDDRDDDDDDEYDGPTVRECRTAADRIVVDDRGVYFKAHLKYDDAGHDVETRTLPYEAFICPVHGIDPEAEKTCLLCVSNL